MPANVRIQHADSRDERGWEFHTNAPVAEAISQPGNYGFVNRNTTSDRTGIPGGVGGGVGYKGYAMFYVGVPNVEAALQKAESLGGTRRNGSPKKTVTWKLKQDVQWHDGEPFTAGDCVFN